ncbi:putative ammonium transporter 3 [Centruroides vittatus]|uniref:putative ammonium transporter 3 n=1 Tax=Centruroides vittatus TaxID=120091 RepID=UPI00350FEF92
MNDSNTTFVPIYSRNERNDANDVVFILTSAFLIFTMQSGYALLESGIVSRKNEVNILIKNATNLLIGGFAYWIFGFSLSFGDGLKTIWFATGRFFTQASVQDMGVLYSKFVFHLGYCTTSTTLVSGSMAERCKFTAYCLVSFLNIFIYCIPAGWMWREDGFLAVLGAVDIGGSGIVHLVGGCSGLVAAIILGPRVGRYDQGFEPLPLGNPTNALLGLFMLWWGWLGFNSGSTFGIMENKWKYSSRAAVTTILASTGGGMVGMCFSFFTKKGLHDVSILMDSVMGSMVAISGGAPIVRPWQAIVIGMIAGLIIVLVVPLLDWLHVDDPTNTFAVHGVGGLWGMIAIGLFPERDTIRNYTRNLSGLFVGGGCKLLIIQILASGCLICWSLLISTIFLLLINVTIGLRMTIEEEIMGPDYVDHNLQHDGNINVLRVLKEKSEGSLRRRNTSHVIRNDNKIHPKSLKISTISNNE